MTSPRTHVSAIPPSWRRLERRRREGWGASLPRRTQEGQGQVTGARDAWGQAAAAAAHFLEAPPSARPPRAGWQPCRRQTRTRRPRRTGRETRAGRLPSVHSAQSATLARRDWGARSSRRRTDSEEVTREARRSQTQRGQVRQSSMPPRQVPHALRRAAVQQRRSGRRKSPCAGSSRRRSRGVRRSRRPAGLQALVRTTGTQRPPPRHAHHELFRHTQPLGVQVPRRHLSSTLARLPARCHTKLPTTPAPSAATKAKS